MGSRIERVRMPQENRYYKMLGEPRFLNDAERDSYLELRNAIETALSPEGLFDFQIVADIAYHIVEIQRVRGAQIAMIKSPAVLADLLKLVFGENTDKARQVALNYFGDDPKKAANAADIIEQAGMTRLQVEGHGIFAQSTRLQLLDQFLQSREASNDRKIKEFRKRQKKRVAKIEREKSTRHGDPSLRRNSRVRLLEGSPRSPRIVSSDGD